MPKRKGTHRKGTRQYKRVHNKGVKTVKKRKQRGGGICGPSSPQANTLDRFANYWYNTMQRDTWYSQGQEGYYFSNRYGCLNCFQAQTHTHIYAMNDLDNNKNGNKEIGWARKIDNVQFDKGQTTLPYNDIAAWLTTQNEEIGANAPCY